MFEIKEDATKQKTPLAAQTSAGKVSECIL